MRRKTLTACAIASLIAAGPALAGPIVINEIRINHPGADVNEYFELSGAPMAPLTGLVYLVIGDDNTGISGVIEEAVFLTGTLDANGLFLAVESSFTLPGTPNLITSLNFENDDNVTHLLVSGFTGTVGDDLDVDDDGTLDVEPWTAVLDAVSNLIDPCGGNAYYAEALGGESVGPEGPFEAGYIFRCTPDGAWSIGLYDEDGAESLDTPGAANAACYPDVDGDGIPDAAPGGFQIVDNCELFNPDQSDCDGDGIGDVCELAAMTQMDVNMNGVPDDCEEIVINEIHYDPAFDAAGDANGDGIRSANDDEFVEIYNNTGADLDLTGWTLSDDFIPRHVFPDGTIIADQCAIVVFGGGAPIGLFGGATTQTASTGSLGFNNGADSAILTDGGSVVRAYYRYGLEGVCDESLTRDPDVTANAPLVAHSTATGSGGDLWSPGTNVDGTSFTGCPEPVDTDGDMIPDLIDNCPNHANPDQADCDDDGAGDVCEIAEGTEQDCNLNEIPDNCEIADGLVQDCNFNGRPDACDIADNPMLDNNMNGVIDSCEVAPPEGLRINEIRASQPGDDLDEYFELKGIGETPLTHLRYIVIGDGAPELGSGVIEAVINLDGEVVPSADDHFVAVEETFTLGPIGATDLVLSGNGLNFEGSDNVTHVLVTNFFGSLGQDLDLDDNGTLDVTPWLGVVDAIGLVEEPNPPSGTEYVYGTDIALGGENIGPEGTFVPGQVYRCETAGTWEIGAFDPIGGDDTPGAVNAACAGGCSGDANGDLEVNFADLLELLANWGSCPGCPADFDLNGVIDFQDLLILLANWGPCA